MHEFEPGWQFASDNTAAMCPEAWAALAAANVGHTPSYGDDPWSARATDLIRALLERDSAQVYFVFNGTAANALGLAALCQSYHSIICHQSAHVQVDECGAPEFFSNGAKLMGVEGAGAKLTPSALLQAIEQRDDVHASKPRAVSISQSTELGTIYQPAEIAQLSAVAHSHGLAFHMDGARFANALAALSARGVQAADLSWRAGVDVLSLGGTKSGMSTTEAVVFFDPLLAEQFEYRRKQAGQLASKMRFQTSQWIGVLESGAWLRHAAHANAAAVKLAAALHRAVGLQPSCAVEANAVFVPLDARVVAALAQLGWHFHESGQAGYRLMCSWATTEMEIERFVADLQCAMDAIPAVI
jgi:threonine aldolase